MTNIHAILHSSVLIEDLERALVFYCGVLQLEIVTTRPDLGYPGAWLWVGPQQIHLLRLPNPDPTQGRPAHGGRDRHIAMAIKSLSELQQRLDGAGIAYTLSKSGRRALFCRDPDGNALEFVE
jgi:glyoxylase I family protein